MVNKKEIIGSDIQHAIERLENGNLVAIPTETVYGLAANALNERAVLRIFEAKKRPVDNPLILHVGDTSQLKKYVLDIPDVAFKLLERFSPGPLTLLLPKKDCIPDIVTAGLKTMAIRIPSNPLTMSLLKQISFPLAAPSANPYGYISPTTAEHVYSMLSEEVDYILDGGKCTVGLESTIVGFDGNTPVIFRHGAITAEQIETCVGSVKINQSRKIVTPGMSEKHYAPKTPVYVVDDIDEEVLKIPHREIGVITYDSYSGLLPVSQQLIIGNLSNPQLIASNIYAAMHDMDKRSFQRILVKKLPEGGIGTAINDRLRRAAKNHK